MSLVPSRQLVYALAIAAAASLLLIPFPALGLFLLAADLVLVGAALLDWLMTPAVTAVEVVRQVPDPVSVLRPQTITLKLRNRAQVALAVRVRDSWPKEWHAEVEELSGRLPPAGNAGWNYTATPKARGQFNWGPIAVRFRSLLGFWERSRSINEPSSARVYPDMTALQRYHVLAQSNRLEMLGIRKVRLRGGAREFESLREYVHGDDVRLIDWKATARRSKLIIRNQEAERNQTVFLLVDCGRLMNAEVDGVAKLDHGVNTALMLAHVALARGDRVGLCTFSHRVHTWVVPRAHKAQNRLILDELYDLRGNYTESDHARCLHMVATRYPKRALLVVLTDFVDAQTAADMISHLRLAARRHVVLFVALNDPFLEKAARLQPDTPFQGFRMAAAVDLLHQRREVLEQLRQLGIHVLDANPAAITPLLINRYLEITFRGLL